MVYFIFFILAFWLIFGILALISPQLVKKFGFKLINLLPMRGWGIIALFGAFVFWAFFNSTNNPLVFKVLAFLALIKGIISIVFPKIRNKWTSLPDWLYRLYGILALVLVYYVFSLL